jgi:hypothetical protein
MNTPQFLVIQAETVKACMELINKALEDLKEKPLKFHSMYFYPEIVHPSTMELQGQPRYVINLVAALEDTTEQDKTSKETRSIFEQVFGNH